MSIFTVMKRIIQVTLFSLTISLNAQFEGAFINHEGGGFVGVEGGYQGFDHLHVKADSAYNGNLRRSMTDVTIRMFAHYSPLEKLSFFVSVPLKYVESSDIYTSLPTQFTDTLPASSMFAVGNVQAGVKYKFFHKKNWVLAASFLGEFKTGRFEESDGMKTGIEAFSFNPTFHVARTFSDRYYVNLDLGGTYRTDDHSGDARIYTEVGGVFWKNQLWLRMGFDMRPSFRNGNYLWNDNRQTGLYLNNREYFSFMFRAEYQHKIGLGVYGGVIAYFNADQMPAFPYVHGGVFYRWKYDVRQDLPFTQEDINTGDKK